VASLSVAAIVVSHAQADLLAKSLAAISEQTHPIQQVVVVETAGDQTSIDLALSYGFSVIEPGPLRLGAAIQAGINSLSDTPGWIWVLHEDAIPEPDALKYLSQAAEISPSVAIIGPKLLELDNSIQIQQLGLTITPTGRPFLLVQREYDQGQHDRAGDTMAVSTAGMLVSLGVWQQLGGLDDSSPVLAQDLEFCAKARVAGYRVVVETNARVHHAGLSMQGKRPRSWLSGSFSQGISRAHLHLATLYLPTALVFAIYLTLPLMVLLSIPGNLLQKRPGRSVAQFSGWIWAWFSIPTRLAARKRFRSLGSLKPLKALIASGAQRSRRRKGKFEVQPEASPESLRPGMFRSNSAWFVLLPLIASIPLFPTGAITANGILPLGSNLEKLLPFVASNSIPVLDSISLPTDPFNWWLLLAALISPAEPSLGFAVLIFASSSVAFFGAWQLGKLFIAKPWVITLMALGYSMSPQLLTLKSNLALVELLAAPTIPWALFFLMRALDAFNSARAWRWTGLLGLTLGLMAAASPMTFALLAVTVLIAALSQPKRGLILLWSYLPAIAVLYPLGRFAIEAQNWILLTQSSSIAMSPTEPFGLVNIVVLSALVLLSLPAWFIADARVNFGLFGFAIAALILSEIQPLNSSAPLTVAATLALLILAALAVERVRQRTISSLIGIFASAAILYSGFTFGVVNQVNPDFKSSRVMPALVVAASEQDSNLRTLVLEVGEPLIASYVWGSGQKLEMSSALLDSYPVSSDIQISLAEIAANLVAGNQDKLVPLLSETRVDFVLLATPNPEVEVGISSLDILQPAGATDYGVLWRVDSQNQSSVSRPKNDPLRPWQFAVVAAFALLALPTRASILGRRRKTGGSK
jgi:GT2 family glycosyltransferase